VATDAWQPFAELIGRADLAGAAAALEALAVSGAGAGRSRAAVASVT